MLEGRMNESHRPAVPGVLVDLQWSRRGGLVVLPVSVQPPAPRQDQLLVGLAPPLR